MNIIWKTPSNSLESVRFEEHMKRVCSLDIKLEDAEGRSISLLLRFSEVVAFKCTYLPALTEDMIKAYNALVDLQTPWLEEASLLAEDFGESGPKRHFRICFEDGPCYEFKCKDFSVDQF